MTDAVSNPLFGLSTEKLQDLFIDQVPQNQSLGMRVLKFAEGCVELDLPYQERLVADIETGALHEGAITILIDTACGVAVLTRIGEFRRPATLDLRIDYRRASRRGQVIRCEAFCEHITDHIALVKANAYDDDSNDPLAMAVGSFAVFMAPATQSPRA